MRKKILTFLLFFVPGFIFMFLYIKNMLTKLLQSDIFDISLNENEEEDF